ncbi:MAG: uridine diphosphate-N-acetylglucosamine-binding protein YvcK [Acidobacteriota bacterium]
MHSLVAVGGGTGLAATLRGLKHAVADGQIDALTAVVTVADDGGSSGRLRRDFGVPPPGDIRNCIVALADDEDLLARLFQFRFENGEGLSGHSFGNLFLTALASVTGDFYRAIVTAESILSVRGRILPATLGDVRLTATGRSGRRYDGESAIGLSGEPITSLELEPASADAFPPACEALADADLILLGPGSHYTSVLPNLLIPGIRDALRVSQAPKVWILNLMTQPGETDHMDAVAHLDALERHAGQGLIDTVLVNNRPPPADVVARYAEAGSDLVEIDQEIFARHGIEVVETDLLADEDDLIRHDPIKLSRAVLTLPSSSANRRSDDRGI